jgi:hypothetical protein
MWCLCPSDGARCFNVRGIPNFAVFSGGLLVMQQAGLVSHDQNNATSTASDSAIGGKGDLQCQCWPDILPVRGSSVRNGCRHGLQAWRTSIILSF